MKSSFATLVLATVALAAPAYAQDTSSQLVGVWKYVSQFNTEVQSGKVTKPFGDNPSGYIIYTKGGRFTFVLFGEGRQKPALPMKDEDRVKLFSSLAAGSATFKAEGNTLTSSYDTSWHELWTGTSQKRTFKVEGDNLTITSDPGKNAAGVDVTFTIVLKRVE
jgi:Lipocalin-like domain